MLPHFFFKTQAGHYVIDVLNFAVFLKCSFPRLSVVHQLVRQLVYAISGDNNLAPIHLWISMDTSYVDPKSLIICTHFSSDMYLSFGISTVSSSFPVCVDVTGFFDLLDAVAVILFGILFPIKSPVAYSVLPIVFRHF